MGEYQSNTEYKASKAAAAAPPAAPVVEPPAEVTIPVPETATAPAPVETVPAPEGEVVAEHRDTAAEKRIAKLVRDREQARTKAAEAEAKAAYLQGILDASKPPEAAAPPAVDPNLPVAEQVQRLLAIEKEKANRETLERRANEALAKARAAHPDLEDLEREVHIDLPNAVLAEIQASDQLDELYYHLMSHPEEARALGAMRHAQAIKTIGRLEERLAKPVPNPVVKAPAPPPPPLNPVKTNAAPATAKVHKYTSY